MKWIDCGVEQNWGSHHTSNANLNVRRFDAGMGWRGTEKAERKGEWLEKRLRVMHKLKRRS